MRKLGQIDQTITSVIVLFAVIFLMLIFTYFTASIQLTKKRTEVTFQTHPVERAAESSAFLNTLLSDSFLVESRRVNVIDALGSVSDAVEDYRVSDGEALSLLSATTSYIKSRYGCDGGNSIAVLMKNPGGSAKLGSYWVLANYPVESKEVTRLDTPLIETNIIDSVNGYSSNPEIYDFPELWFVPALYQTRDNGAAVYPASDVLNELPQFIVVARGSVLC